MAYTKHERVSRDLKRLTDTGKLILDDPEIHRLTIEKLPNNKFELNFSWPDDDETTCVIVNWSTVIHEVTNFYTMLEELECL